ncbi:MAG: oligopeptide transporter, OPT family, partial [Clostridia bacterium]|nr:oligopeptide transporter, OPT family [Clostridia bacterium]
MVGGLVRLMVEKLKYKNDEEKENAIQSGVLYSSGMIAGEGILGIILAVLAIIKIKGTAISEMINLSDAINLGSIGGLVFFVLLTASFFVFAFAGKKNNR